MNTPSFNYQSIQTFEDACKALNIDAKQLPDTSNLHDELGKPIVAHYKLMVIYEAINNGWVPDWSERNQCKYFPWFEVLPSGSGFSVSTYRYTFTTTDVGSRLCTDTSDKALYMAKQFEAEYKDLFLYSK